MIVFSVSLDLLMQMVGTSYDLGAATGIDVLVNQLPKGAGKPELDALLAGRRAVDLDIIRKKIEKEFGT